jgi:uncharacterized membrane protein YdbT with pleckstrin-like domain
MPIPAKHLEDDEEVFLDVRPHWIRLLGPAMMGVFFLGAVIAGFVVWSSAPRWFGVLLACVLVVVFLFDMARFVRWRTTNLVVTSYRIIYRTGVMHRVGREIPIDRVQDVTFEQHLFERLIGVGILTIESAGDHGSDTIPDVAHPAAVQGIMNRARRTPGSREPHVAASSQRVGVASELAALDDLRQRGILTETEFQQKKAELLDEF